MNILGQHFLKNKSAIKQIVAALEIAEGDTIVEIGPGHGELTEIIDHGAWSMKHEIKIFAIEKDKRLADALREKFRINKNIEIVDGDALKILPHLCSVLHDSCFKIVGNIPYYITGHLLRVVGDLKKKPALCVFTVQKEVAERLAARPPRMNRLAASVQFWADTSMIAIVSRKDFFPQPEVDSAIIKLKIKNQKSKIEDAGYYAAVRMLFAQPRKTVLNNLEAGVKTENKNRKYGREKAEEILIKIGVLPESRPQNLTIEDIVKITSLTHDL
jgi:16S rRNA (adenine1518-N6/adenine1519-N6)-dimethyltransferase